MKCPRCNVEMKTGIAIDAGSTPHGAIVFTRQSYTHATLKLIKVYKCPKCGHSDDGVDPVKLVGIVDNR